MMKTAELLSNTDRTSWTRILMVGRYFWPRLRMKVILFPLVSLALCFLSYIFGVLLGINNAPSPFPLSLINYLIIFSPLAFAKRSDSEVTASLPALGCEKVWFIFLYTFVFIPLIVMVPAELAIYLCYGHIDMTAILTTSQALSMFSQHETMFWVSSYVSTIAMTATCLWVVMARSSQRTLFGIICPLAINFGYGLVAGVFGFIFGIRDAINRLGDSVDPEAMTNAVENIVVNMIQWGTLAFVIYGLFAIWKAMRAISHRQI